jgi:hypothetical protein
VPLSVLRAVSPRPGGRASLAFFPVLALATAILGAACSAPTATGTGGSGGAGTVCSGDLASIQATIFTPSCALAGCHAADAPAAGLVLAAGTDVAGQLVGVPSALCDGWTRVVPGSLDASLLYDKVTEQTPACGLHMPSSGDLSAQQKECVRAWIASLPASDGGPGDAGGGDGCSTCGGSACVDLQTDPAHCGACATACPAGAGCSAGACACAGGLAACGAKCADTSSDTANCGGCGKVCPTGALCMAGQCACPSGTTACGGACVSTSSDGANCGVCGKVCPAGDVCNQGACASGCGALTKCGTSCVDTQTSAANCGACGNACPAGASCAAGQCQCPSGTADCGGTCINVATDPGNCGTCGKVCMAGTTCVGGQCQCPGGGALCGSTCVATQTDTGNCGACGNACAVGQTCNAGVCTCGTASVSFSGAVQPIFTASCASAGCHKGATAQKGLNLSVGASYAKLVNVLTAECSDGRKLVLPGQPSQSYLVEKLMGVSLCSGTQMPKMGAIPSAEIQTISNWICAGAPNN